MLHNPDKAAGACSEYPVTFRDVTYELPWYADRDVLDGTAELSDGYTAQDYTLAYALGVPHNRSAEQVVYNAVTRHCPNLAQRVRFESEMGCFFAHTETRSDIETLARIVAELVAERNPGMTAGTIRESPAYLSW